MALKVVNFRMEGRVDLPGEVKTNGCKFGDSSDVALIASFIDMDSQAPMLATENAFLIRIAASNDAKMSP